MRRIQIGKSTGAKHCPRCMRIKENALLEQMRAGTCCDIEGCFFQKEIEELIAKQHGKDFNKDRKRSKKVSSARVWLSAFIGITIAILIFYIINSIYFSQRVPYTATSNTPKTSVPEPPKDTTSSKNLHKLETDTPATSSHQNNSILSENEKTSIEEETRILISSMEISKMSGQPINENNYQKAKRNLGILKRTGNFKYVEYQRAFNRLKADMPSSSSHQNNSILSENEKTSIEEETRILISCMEISKMSGQPISESNYQKAKRNLDVLKKINSYKYGEYQRAFNRLKADMPASSSHQNNSKLSKNKKTSIEEETRILISSMEISKMSGQPINENNYKKAKRNLAILKRNGSFKYGEYQRAFNRLKAND